MKVFDSLIEQEVRHFSFQNEQFINRETTGLDQLIGQIHLQKIKCASCGSVKCTQFNSRTLLVPICKSLKQSFNKLTQPVEIENYKCASCNKEVTIQKTLEVAECPRVFCVQI